MISRMGSNFDIASHPELDMTLTLDIAPDRISCGNAIRYFIPCGQPQRDIGQWADAIAKTKYFFSSTSCLNRAVPFRRGLYRQLCDIENQFFGKIFTQLTE
jgi:hypothetical protein